MNIFVVLNVPFVGFDKVEHPLSYFIGVPICTWVAYLLSNAFCSDLIFGEY